MTIIKDWKRDTVIFNPLANTEMAILCYDYEFVYKQFYVCLPQGMRSDGGTIPNWLLSATGGRFDPKAVTGYFTHDYVCANKIAPPSCDTLEKKIMWANQLQYDIHIAHGVDKLLAKTIKFTVDRFLHLSYGDDALGVRLDLLPSEIIPN